MKIYLVTIRDSDDIWGQDYERIGVFSTKELAEECGSHAAERENVCHGKQSWIFNVCEQLLDEYYLHNLTPLAESMGEDDE